MVAVNDIKGLSGEYQLRKAKPGVTLEQLKSASKDNNLQEIIVENEDGLHVAYGKRVQIQNEYFTEEQKSFPYKCREPENPTLVKDCFVSATVSTAHPTGSASLGLERPKVGERVDLGGLKGTLKLVDDSRPFAEKVGMTGAAIGAVTGAAAGGAAALGLLMLMFKHSSGGIATNPAVRFLEGEAAAMGLLVCGGGLLTAIGVGGVGGAAIGGGVAYSLGRKMKDPSPDVAKLETLTLPE